MCKIKDWKCNTVVGDGSGCGICGSSVELEWFECSNMLTILQRVFGSVKGVTNCGLQNPDDKAGEYIRHL